MGLQPQTIRKLLREDFPGAAPLVVEPAGREKLAAEITARLARFEGVDTKNHGYIYEAEKDRHVCSFTVIDPEPYYHYGGRHSFRLVLGDDNRLTLKGYDAKQVALVSDLDELVRFVQHCKERLQRKRALQAKRGKVRDLLSQAILAQVRNLAREERFDFMSVSDAQKLNLYVKLAQAHALELNIPFSQFKEILPQLRSVIAALRQLYQSGIRFHVVGTRGLPWRKTWVTYQSLEGDAPPDGAGHGGAADGDSH